ncbi:hypothetical protein [Filimonas effusa]|uniref:Uncharacterized protein n=1 Tax=Filimonas effusa TaxID=2508721 RepID=A0A4Q1DBC5_9BACT|nr:hypothetical protein [Filimonas effusa]RXK86742.1 hypothetical protein ESB13_08055 [Filimonas effusa]
MAKRAYSENRDKVLKQRLLNLGEAIIGGKVKTWDQVFAFVEPTPLAETLNIPYYTFLNKIATTDKFTVGDCKVLAKHAGIDANVAFTFIASVKPKKA